MNRYLIIFVLYSACYAVSVSQLEQLQKARKDIATALNQYNTIAQMDIKQINAWKKKIQGYLSIIKRFDPEDGKNLENKMVNATFQAVDRIVEQKKSLSKTSFLQKDSSKQTIQEPMIGIAQFQQATEKPIETDISQPQSTEPIISVELKKINAIKNEIEQMIQLYRQSDDWYNVFEDLLQKIDAKDADAYRVRVPQRATLKDAQKTSLIYSDEKIVPIVPQAKNKQEQQSAHITQSKKRVDEPQSKETASKDVIEHPLNPEIIIIPVEPLIQEQPIESKSSQQEQSTGLVKKTPILPQSKNKQEQLTNAIASKNIDEPQSKEMASKGVIENQLKKTPILPQGKNKQSQSIDAIVSKNVNEPQSKETALKDVIENPLAPLTIIPVEPLIQKQPIESGSPQSKKTSIKGNKKKQEKVDLKGQTKVNGGNEIIERKVAEPEPQIIQNESKSSFDIKEAPVKQKPLESSKATQEAYESDDDLYFAVDINNV